jgi:putative restriction endonuclease
LGKWRLVLDDGKMPAEMSLKSQELELTADSKWSSTIEMGGELAGMTLKGAGTWAIAPDGVAHPNGADKGTSRADVRSGRLTLDPDFHLPCTSTSGRGASPNGRSRSPGGAAPRSDARKIRRRRGRPGGYHMSRESVLHKFNKLNVWSRGDQRAPHRPLLVLYALGRWVRGDARDISFRDVERDLTPLLKEFGPPRRSYHPEFPYWHLKSDSVWEVHADAPFPARKGHSSPRKGDLLAPHASAGFTDEVKAALRSDPALAGEIAARLLQRHFPETLHQDILDSVGLTLGTGAKKRKRDPDFRRRVLMAYECTCAVCGFDVRLGSVSIALDAAQIRWHQFGGPDQESNGLARCVLHHKTFDLSVFTLGKDGGFLVSDEAHGTAGFDELVMRHHGRPVRKPQRPEWKPAPDFVAWHLREVFKGEARHLEAEGGGGL